MPQYLYVIRRADGCRKVGRSRHPRERIPQLYRQVPPALAASLALEHQAECPAEQIARAEWYAHYLLRDYRDIGEWFLVTGEEARRAVDAAAAIAEHGGPFPTAPVKRTTLAIPLSLYELVEDYRFRNRHQTISDAILDLIEAGLLAAHPLAPKADKGA